MTEDEPRVVFVELDEQIVDVVVRIFRRLVEIDIEE
jgi:hypothetical protein